MDVADVWHRGALAPPGSLVDQYGRGVLDGELGLGTFETYLAAAVGAHSGVPPHGSSFFDTRLGIAVRRWCPPLLGLEAHCPPVRYLARRRELGAYAAGRTLLRGSGIGGFLMDTAGQCDPNGPGLASSQEMAAAVGGRCREAVCLASLAGQLADTSGSVDAFLRNAAEALHGVGAGADTGAAEGGGAGTGAGTGVGAFVSGAGFHEAAPPGPREVRRAADRWLRARSRAYRRHPGAAVAGADVPEEPALVRHLLWAALPTGRPVQLRCGDPAPLERFLAATAGLGARVVLLPEYPHHRAAARLAAAFPHVYSDVGPVPGETLAEAPFGKLLFSTGAWALPELYVVAARRFAGEMARLMTGWIEDGGCVPSDAARITRQIAGGNARRLYRLEAASG